MTDPDRGAPPNGPRYQTKITHIVTIDHPTAGRFVSDGTWGTRVTNPTIQPVLEIFGINERSPEGVQAMVPGPGDRPLAQRHELPAPMRASLEAAIGGLDRTGGKPLHLSMFRLESQMLQDGMPVPCVVRFFGAADELLTAYESSLMLVTSAAPHDHEYRLGTTGDSQDSGDPPPIGVWHKASGHLVGFVTPCTLFGDPFGSAPAGLGNPARN